MTEEEKFVIKMLKDSQNTYIEDTKVTQVLLTTEEAKILLNLIEKQQKEMASMQMNYEAKIDKMEYEMGYHYISKDKIRDKIKELEEKEKNCHFTGLITECEIKIEVLNELLEE